MKFKYYLRGLGIGILISTIILSISFAMKKNDLSDDEIIARAKELGMVMEDTGKDTIPKATETEDEIPKSTEDGFNTEQQTKFMIILWQELCHSEKMLY